MQAAPGRQDILTYQDQLAPVVPDPPPEEQVWVARAQQGDVRAFNALVLSYQRQVYNLAYRMLGNADDAADVTQDAFVSAYRAIKSLRGQVFRAWLLRIAANACRDQIRRRKRRPTESLDHLVGEVGDAGLPPDPDVGPESRALSAEMMAWVQKGLLALPEDQRLVIVLSDIQGYDYDEIGVALELPLGTVKSRLSRARARLRDFFSVEGEPLG